MTAIDAMPASALACVRLLACPVCQPTGAFPRYVPTCWPVAVCPACVGDPTVRRQLEAACDTAMQGSEQADLLWQAAQDAAPTQTVRAWHRLHRLRAAIDAGHVTKAEFLDYWKAAQGIAGLPGLYRAWQLRTATMQAHTRIVEATLPRLNALLAALDALERLP